MFISKHRDLGHLTYCTNIHTGVDWSDMITSLRQWVPSIKTKVAKDQPFGLGLRIAAAACHELTHGNAYNELKAFLEETKTYVFTINGFPYGPFHGQPVKSQVYAPDWQTPERLAYTNDLADLLAKLLPHGLDGSISTVPGSFKPWSVGKEEAIASGLIAHVAHLIEIERQTGQTIRLALEPEPCCMLETIAETIAYFERYLFSGAATTELAKLNGMASTQAEDALRRHIGVCYDVCHAAVEYEDPIESIHHLKRAGISIPKLQLSSALRIKTVGARARDLLAPFNEPVYLHQVITHNVAHEATELKRYTDLPAALADLSSNQGDEWRIHFHIPIFIRTLKGLGTTQFFLKDILALHAREPISDHLEVETYTWDVLPEKYRKIDVASAIVRELNWVRRHLE